MPARSFPLDVHPRLPDAIARLDELASNLWYSWHRPARLLLEQLAPELWQRVGHSPKLFLRSVDQAVLDEAASDALFLAKYESVLSTYDNYHRNEAPAGIAAGFAEDDLIAYMCAEYGLHESLQTYSGGLGILAGHHCKTASDLRLPFLGVGLLYRAGYFTQTIDGEGRQIATHVRSRFADAPISPTKTAQGEEVVVEIEFPERTVAARVWQVRAGRVVVYLLDTDLARNSDADRDITRQLYGGDVKTRIEQEIVLGVGGVRALRRLGLSPTVWHMNEGHPAFSLLERVRELVGDGEHPAAALETVAASTVFTTHTPVPAGHDVFPGALLAQYIEPLLAGSPGLESADFLAMGRSADDDPFNMTTFAIRGSRHQNGVSRLHGDVSSDICGGCWPQIPADENPMSYVTNGVHIATVLAQDWVDLFDRFLGADWQHHLSNRQYWSRIDEISDQLFWSVRQLIKAKTLAFVRASLERQHQRNQISEPHIERQLRLLEPADPNVLTIGFARRFATYKRADLLFRDLDWLERIVNNPDRPVVFVFAGKAHPADEPGQAVLRRVHEVSNLPAFVGKVVLVEGYDLALARTLVAGVDVWLNNPIHKTEASGTSGMKAAVNGTINLSVTDGWWAEGYEGNNGWALKPSPHDDDPERREDEDARTLYEILEDQVLPMYYDHGRFGFSSSWVAMAKRSMASVLPRFNMNRVVEEYTERLYLPAASGGRRLEAAGRAPARQLAEWRSRIEHAWPGVSIRLQERPEQAVHFGQAIEITAAVALNGLAPEDLTVELVLEPGDNPGVDSAGPHHAASFAFEPHGVIEGSTSHRYRLSLKPTTCGRSAYRIRVYPSHELLSHRFEMGRMLWVQ